MTTNQTPNPLKAGEAASELLPCPFCESGDVERSEGKTANGSPWHYIECTSCSACAEPQFWNRRAPSQADRAANVVAVSEIPPFSELARLTAWLDAKYARHKEIEDHEASMLLHTLWRAALAQQQAFPTPQSKEEYLAQTADTLERLDQKAADRRERLGLQAVEVLGYVLVPRELLRDAEVSIDDYRAGLEFGAHDRKLLGRLKAAIAAATPPSTQGAQALAVAEPLTVEQVLALADKADLARDYNNDGDVQSTRREDADITEDVVHFARAIEAAHGIGQALPVGREPT